MTHDQRTWLVFFIACGLGLVVDDASYLTRLICLIGFVLSAIMFIKEPQDGGK